MTTSALEVEIMSKLSKRISGVIMKLKVLKNLFLTITEEGDTERQLCFVDDNVNISETKRRLQSMVKSANVRDRSKLWTAKKRTEHTADTPVGRSAGKFEDNEDATVDMEKVIQCVREIQQCWFRQIKTLESLKTNCDSAQPDKLSPKHEPIPDEYQEVASLIQKLCCIYLRSATKDLTGSGEPGTKNLDYLADILPPNLCKDAMEYHKPTVTLKSCIFKYIIIGALLSGELPQCFTVEDEDTEHTDLEAVVWVLNKLRESKQLRHPLLGIPIQTYSLAYRGFVVAPRAAASHIENRLSEILYNFLDTLLYILDDSEQFWI